VLRGRVRKRTKSLTLDGSWSGEYGYDIPKGRHNVPFNATLNELDGALSGLMDEPNTFGHPSAPRLYASLDGVRQGAAVRFVKTYDGVGGIRHAVVYQGEANATFTRIDGVWSVGSFRGPFYMQRHVAATDAEEAEREAEA
jgi:hypothetical protein